MLNRAEVLNRIIYDALALNREVKNALADKFLTETTTRSWIHDFGIVSIGCGRGSGKTAWINKYAPENSCILTQIGSVEVYKDSRAVTYILPKEPNKGFMFRGTLHSLIIVENASWWADKYLLMDAISLLFRDPTCQTVLMLG